jgi:hypothetical protein
LFLLANTHHHLRHRHHAFYVRLTILSCQEMLTSKRTTIVSALPTLEDLVLGKVG